MKKLKLFSLLLLTQLIVPSSSYAFFGWGKFPSRFDAQQACSDWRKKGIQITYQDYELVENPEWKAFIKKKFPDRGSWKSRHYDYGGGDWKWNRAREEMDDRIASSEKDAL